MKKVLLRGFFLGLFCSGSLLQAENPPVPKERPLGLTSLTDESPNTKLSAKGEVPTWLDGTLVVNGPALFNVGDAYVKYWFDGLAMLHSFHCSNGEVYYRNKFLRTSAYEKMTIEHSLDFAGFDQAGSKQETAFIPNANINVGKFANNFVALAETPLPVIFDLATLNTLGQLSYTDNTLPKSHIWECAHPQYDAVTGDVISYQIQFFPQAKYVIYRMKKGSATREMIAEIPVTEPAYMHSFALTENSVILVEFPLFVNPQDILKGGSFRSHYKWNGNKQMRILVVNRKTGQIGEYLAEPVFAWHHINSYEQDGTIVLDMAAYSDATTFLTPDSAGEDPEHRRMGRFIRYKVLTATKKVIKEELGPSIEMPRINYDLYNGKPYKFVYGYDDAHPLEGLKKRGLIKIDTITKQSIMWSEDGCIADEPVFVARPNGINEDDGVVLACVLDTKKRVSFLLILDAIKFKEVARLEAPHHIPYTLHGDFFMKK